MSHLTLDSISKYFHMTADDACFFLDVCKDTLYRRCKELGFIWPYIKFHAINKEINFIQNVIHITSDSKIISELKAESERLTGIKNKLMVNPNLDLEELMPVDERKNRRDRKKYLINEEGKIVSNNIAVLKNISSKDITRSPIENMLYTEYDNAYPSHNIIEEIISQGQIPINQLPSITFEDSWLMGFNELKQTLPPIRSLPIWRDFPIRKN